MEALVIIIFFAIVICFFKKQYNKSKVQATNDAIKLPKLNISIETSDHTREYKFETEIEGEKVILLADKLDIPSENYNANWFDVIFRGKRYGYSPEISKWSYHKTGTPPDIYIDKISDWINSQLPKLQMATLKEGSIKTIYRNVGKTKFSLKGNILNNNITAYLKYTDKCFTINYNNTEWYCSPSTWEYSKFPINGDYLKNALIHWLKNEYVSLQTINITADSDNTHG